MPWPSADSATQERDDWLQPQPRPLSLRIARWLAGKRWPAAPTTKQTKEPDTTKGLSPEVLTYRQWGIELDTTRADIYRDMEEIDAVSPEGSRALDILADNAVNNTEGSQRSFVVRFDEGRKVSQAKQDLILALIERTRLQEMVYPICREMLKYGDNFQEIVVTPDMHIERLNYLSPESMRRNEDAHGRLKVWTRRAEPDKGDAPFEQYEPGTTRRLAWFYAWQVEHARWNRNGDSKYGRPQLLSGRYPFKKLQSMEEALVINWLTRAFARLLFKLDVTGKSSTQAQATIAAFMRSLSRRDVSDGMSAVERLSVAKDIVIGVQRENYGGRWEPKLDDVSILDTSNTGFWNISAIEYWRNKFVSATGVPKAHLGLEKEINAKATLQWQDERFSRTVRRVQMTMSEFLSHIIDFELVLQGMDPTGVDYVIAWPSPSTQDRREEAETVNYIAQASAILAQLGVVSPDYIAQQWLKMPPAQWERTRDEVQAAGVPVPQGDDRGNGKQPEGARVADKQR